MRILVVGGGPAGLSFALSLMRGDSRHSVLVVDKAESADVSGWGITLTPETLRVIGHDDSCCHLDSFSISFDQQRFLTAPIDVRGIGRQRLVEFLRARCASAGVSFRFGERLDQLAEPELDEFDLVVGADGANSAIRRCFPDAFGETIETSAIYHAWFATPHRFEGQLRRMFRGYQGAVFCASGYQFSPTSSTFIVECTATGLARGDFAAADDREACDLVARIFEEDLEGQPVKIGRNLRWHRFARVSNARWHHRNIVLLGDAAHTTHFSKGYGTVAAIKDGVSLAQRLSEGGSVESAVVAFEQERKPLMTTSQLKAEFAREWYGRLMSLYETESAAAMRDELASVHRRLMDEMSANAL